MNTSCISHPANNPLIIIREWQLKACGDRVAAALLSFFEYWHNIKLRNSKQADFYNDVAEGHGDRRSQYNGLLQWHTTEQLEAGILIFKKKAIAEGIQILVNLGFLEVTRNPNPRYSFDKTRYFLFKPENVNRWLRSNYTPTPPDDREKVLPENPITDDFSKEDDRWGENTPSMGQDSLDRQGKKEENAQNPCYDQLDENDSIDGIKPLDRGVFSPHGRTKRDHILRLQSKITSLDPDLPPTPLKKSEEREEDFFVKPEIGELLVTSSEEAQIPNGSLVKANFSGEDKFSARRRFKNLAEQLPEGPWLVDGKLDREFQTWLAQKWMQDFGKKDIYAAKADVLAHFLNNPEKLIVRWEQYSDETLHRYAATQIRVANGIAIAAEEQQMLVSRQRAVTCQLSPEQKLTSTTENAPKILPFLPQGTIHHQEEQPRLIAQISHGEQEVIQEPAIAIPIESEPAIAQQLEGHENPQAYQVYKPKPLEDKPLEPEQVAQLWKKMGSLFKMPSQSESVKTTKNELDELNQWIKDPILRKEGLRKAIALGYRVLYDEEGIPYEIEEIDF